MDYRETAAGLKRGFSLKSPSRNTEHIELVLGRKVTTYQSTFQFLKPERAPKALSLTPLIPHSALLADLHLCVSEQSRRPSGQILSLRSTLGLDGS